MHIHAVQLFGYAVGTVAPVRTPTRSSCISLTLWHGYHQTSPPAVIFGEIDQRYQLPLLTFGSTKTGGIDLPVPDGYYDLTIPEDTFQREPTYRLYATDHQQSLSSHHIGLLRLSHECAFLRC